jgi:mannose-6-phosphate isomerase-like protein (cupin superfamily)
MTPDHISGKMALPGRFFCSMLCSRDNRSVAESGGIVTMAPQPRHFSPGEGRTYKLGRITLTFKMTAADTAGAYTLCEAIEPAGSGADLHRHPTYDETHIICAGRYECRLGDQILTLGPGEMMFAPRGTPHSIKSAGPDTGLELIVSSPGGIFDAFIEEVTASMTESGSPSESRPAIDFRAIAAKYGIEFLS